VPSRRALMAADWGRSRVPNTATVKFFSIDNVGNTEAVKSQLIQIDTVVSSATTISCNSATCSTGWYKTTPVTVAFGKHDWRPSPLRMAKHPSRLPGYPTVVNTATTDGGCGSSEPALDSVNIG